MKSIERFLPREAGQRDWGHELIIAETATYLGKVLRMAGGTAGGLQFHRAKVETFHLLIGTADVDFDDGTGHLVTETMSPGESWHIPAGAPHRVRAITDCVFFEVSTPHHDDRVRVEAQYGEPEGGGLPTTR